MYVCVWIALMLTHLQWGVATVFYYFRRSMHYLLSLSLSLSCPLSLALSLLPSLARVLPPPSRSLLPSLSCPLLLAFSLLHLALFIPILQVRLTSLFCCCLLWLALVSGVGNSHTRTKGDSVY